MSIHTFILGLKKNCFYKKCRLILSEVQKIQICTDSHGTFSLSFSVSEYNILLTYQHHLYRELPCYQLIVGVRILGEGDSGIPPPPSSESESLLSTPSVLSSCMCSFRANSTRFFSSFLAPGLLMCSFFFFFSA